MNRNEFLVRKMETMMVTCVRMLDELRLSFGRWIHFFRDMLVAG
jgi:hypothetical protein